MAKFPELRGRRILITGGASGIGAATVGRFVEEGARVAALDANDAALKALTAQYPSVLALAADVSHAEALAGAFATMETSFGGLDVVIANAGISIRHDFLDITWDEWQRVMNVNLSGVFLTAQEALKRMRPQGGGRILMTASTNGYRGHPHYADYNASKAGVILLMKTLAKEYAPEILVNAVCPGYVLTPMQEREYTADMLAAVNASLPLQRHATPQEIAGVFAFLASDESRYITGQCITIDGGETI